MTKVRLGVVRQRLIRQCVSSERLEPRLVLSAGLFQGAEAGGLDYPLGHFDPVGLTLSGDVSRAGSPYTAKLAFGAAGGSVFTPVSPASGDTTRRYQTDFIVSLPDKNGGVSFAWQNFAPSAGSGRAYSALAATSSPGSVVVGLHTDASGKSYLSYGAEGIHQLNYPITSLSFASRPVEVSIRDVGGTLSIRLEDLSTRTSGSPRTQTVQLVAPPAGTIPPSGTSSGQVAYAGFTGDPNGGELLDWSFSGLLPTTRGFGSATASLTSQPSGEILTGSGTGIANGPSSADALAVSTRKIAADQAVAEAVVNPPSGTSTAAGLVLASQGTLAASVYVQGGKAYFSSRYTSDSAPVTNAGLAVSSSPRLRLVRNDATVSGYVLTGNKWTLVGTGPVRGIASPELGVATWSGGTATATASFTDVSVDGIQPMGADTGAAGTQSRDATGIWADVIKQADAWLKPDKSGLASVDSAGNPTEDFRTRVMTPLWNSLGTYHLSLITGSNAVPKLEAYYATISNQSFNPATGLFQADLTYSRGNGDADIILTGLDRGAHDIHMFRPGYGPSSGTITSEYASYLSKIGVRALRTMNLTETNDNPVRTWSERTLPTDPTQLQTKLLRRMDGSSSGNVQKKKGAAWESVVELANKAHADLWINVPAQADDNYILSLAKLIKNGSTVNGVYYPGLDPDLNLYIEYSNEVWNPGFDAYHWAEDHAKAEIVAADASGTTADVDYDHLDRTLSGTPSVWALRWYARQLAQVSNIFKGVFGVQAMNTRVRPVLSNRPFKGQYEDMLAFVNQFVAPPSSVFYALGTIPYMNLNGPNNTENKWNGGNNNPNLTADQVLQTLALNSQALTSQYVQFRDISNKYGIKMVAYEAGTDTSGYLAQDARAAAQRDPRMTQLLESYAQNWFSHGGSLMMYFTADVGGYGKQSGDFKLTEDITQLGGAKTVGYRLASDSEASLPAPLEPYELRTSTGSDNTSVNLSWKQPTTGTQPSAYEVEQSTSADFQQSDTFVPVATSGATVNWTVRGLAPGTAYYFRVRAVAPSGKSEPSGPATRATSGTAVAPPSPSSVALSAVSNSQVRLTWIDNASNETAYQVQLASDTAFSTPLRDVTFTATPLGDATSADLYGLDSSKTYYARVRTLGTAGNSGWVSAGSVTTASLSPIASYSFEETSGTTITDSASSPVNGTLVGGATRGAGFSGQAVTLDGSSGYIDLGRASKLNTAGQFSVSAWVKPTAVTSKADVAVQDWDGVNTPWYLRIEDPNTVVFGSYHMRWWGSPPDEARAQLPYTLTDGQWHHLAGTYDGTAFALYVDGVKVAEKADAYGVSRGTQSVNLGRNSNNGGGSRNYFQGALDEVKFFNSGLGAGDIAKLAAGAKPGGSIPTVPTTTVDNRSGAFSTTGRWWSSSSVTGYFGSDYYNDGNTNKGSASGTWKLSPNSAGRYAVFARWVSTSTSSTAVPFAVVTSTGTVTVSVDESRNSGTWRLLGTFDLDPATASVTIRNAGTSGLVTADAVGFAPSTGPVNVNPDSAPPAGGGTTGGGGTSTAPTPPAGYTFAANEGGTYTFSSPTDVAYGANGQFNYKTGVTGTVTFDNSVFGDPIPGVYKAGFFKAPSTTPTGPTPPSGYTYAAGEYQTYTFSSPVDVAYGANGQFAYKYGVTGTVTFNNATFGDPVPGSYKSGFYRAASGTPVTVSGPTLVLDNRDSSFASTGRWWNSTSPSGYVGSEYLNNGNTLQGTTSAAWTPGSKLTTRRTYSVYLRYVAGTNNAPSVPVDVLTTTGVVPVNVDQTKAPTDPSGYLLLGQWELDPTTAYVKIRTDSTRGTVTVDAIGFA